MNTATSIEGVIGHEALCVLVVHYGGQAVYVSRKLSCRMTELIGQDRAERLITMYSGERVDVPTLQQVRAAAHDPLSDTMYNMSAADIAQRCGISTRHAHRLKKRGN